ncbi:MAG: hypothetical protein Nk1A_3940 [Endomicrobiia bacterium]|nr:MAG: hypothetical protein Nk1A_3940 [Endomicrobiia bacterium]
MNLKITAFIFIILFYHIFYYKKLEHNKLTNPSTIIAKNYNLSKFLFVITILSTYFYSFTYISMRINEKRIYLNIEGIVTDIIKLPILTDDFLFHIILT